MILSICSAVSGMVVLVMSMRLARSPDDWVLPVALALFIGAHIYLVIRNGISAPPQKDE